MTGDLLLVGLTVGRDFYLSWLMIFKYLWGWILAVAVLATYLWERWYVKRHYTRREWTASLQTLDSFVPGPEDPDWVKVEEGDETFSREPVLAYRNHGVTPYREAYTTPIGRKAYDLPPDFPLDGLPADTTGAPQALPSASRSATALARATPSPAWKAGLAQGDFILAPDMRSRTTRKKSGGNNSVPLSSGEIDPTDKRMFAGASSSNQASGSQPKGRGRWVWVPDHRYMDEKRQIVEGNFGAALSRTQSI